MPQNDKPEEEKREEPQPAKPPESNGAMTPEDLEALKAELEAEKKAIAQAQAMIQDKDSQIQKLQATISVVQQAAETASAELTQLKDAHSKAVAKYLDMARALNPALPPDAIAGSTIDEIDASVAKARSIAESVKKALDAQAREARVPAGAPARTSIVPEGLSPREKIVAGLAQKGMSP